MLIIFDCDGVLVDSEIIANRVLAAHLSRHGYPVTAAEAREKFLGRTIAGVVATVRDEDVALPDDFEATLRTLDEAAFARDLKAVAGAPQMLERLATTPKCVASSGRPEKIRRNLELTGLAGYFENHLFSAIEVDKPKPAPDLFHLAAARMNASADTCTVIEDTALGIEAAKRAGMRAFGFIGASHRSPSDGAALRRAGADLMFDDMTQLPSLL